VCFWLVVDIPDHHDRYDGSLLFHDEKDAPYGLLHDG
jgi:hypothetical protein